MKIGLSWRPRWPRYEYGILWFHITATYNADLVDPQESLRLAREVGAAVTNTTGAAHVVVRRRPGGAWRDFAGRPVDEIWKEALR